MLLNIVWEYLLVVLMTSLLTATAEDSLIIKIPRFGQIHNMKERVDKHMEANYLLLPHIYRSFINAGGNAEFLSNDSVSLLCRRDLQQYYHGLVTKKSWAWKMYDATGKQESGIFLGSTTWSGNFDECLNVPATACDQEDVNCDEHDQPAPQFCSVQMTHAPWRPKMIEAFKLPFPVPNSPFIVDVCVPKNCTNADIFTIVTVFLAVDNFQDNITVTHVNCNIRKRLADDPTAIFSVSVLTSILGLVILGTSYDIFRRRRKLRIKTGPEVTIGYDDHTDRYGILKITVPKKKLHGRRGTLSSSENMEHALAKEYSDNVVEPRRASESLHTERKNSKVMRKLSCPAGHTELQEILEETAETNGHSATVLSDHSVSDVSPPTEEVMSDDEMSILGDSKNNISATSIAGRKNLGRETSIIEVRPSHRNKKLALSSNLLTDLLLSFSFRKNTRHILADGSPDTLFCLNGVRVLSICWIVLGNVYGIIYQNPDIVDNSVLAVRMTQAFWMQMVINTTLAADSFFVLSGTLMAYNFLKLKTKAGKHKNGWKRVMSIKEYGFMIVHRLVRIFPCYAVVIILATSLMPYLGRGPRWSYEIETVKICKRNWWSNLLFISNYYDSSNMCLPHTYYLPNDFQFFMFSPVVLIPLLLAPKIGLGLVGLLVVIQIVCVGSLNVGINGNVLRMKTNNYFSLIYVKPYSRIGVYSIGLALGYLLFSCDRQMRFRKLPLYLGWILACGVVFTLPYITYLENRPGGQAWSGVETAMYEAFSRPAWALALSWIIFACSTGQGAFVGKLLSWNVFLPLCRITYGVFLFHPVIISVVIESSYHNVYLTFGELVYTYIAMLVCCWGLAFIIISCIECPFTTFESHVRLRFKTWMANRLYRNLQQP